MIIKIPIFCNNTLVVSYIFITSFDNDRARTPRHRHRLEIPCSTIIANVRMLDDTHKLHFFMSYSYK